MTVTAPVSLVPLFESATKRARVTDTIGNYVLVHKGTDLGITLGTAWLPAGGFIAMLGSMGVQAPLIYQPMVQKIAKSYLSSTDRETKSMLEDAAIEGGMYDIAATFGTEFLVEIFGELLSEAGIGALIGFVPILGTIAAAYLDVKIAATMTWRVGITAAIYFENGCEWLGDRASTYERAKLLCGPLSAKGTDRYNLNNIQDDVSGLRSHQITLIERYARQLLGLTGLDQVAQILLERHHVNRDLVEAVLLEVRGRRIDDGRPSAASQGFDVTRFNPEAVTKARAFIMGMRVVGMSAGEIIRLGAHHGLDADLLEILLTSS